MNKSALLTETKLKNSAKRLKTSLNEKGLDIKYNETLQLQCQSLFCKPYEEVKATILKESDTHNPVFILKYGSESIIVFNGEYITQRDIGTDTEISEDQLYKVAESLANSNNTIISKLFLPLVLDEDWEVEDVISLAKRMGYFTYETTIFDEFNNEGATIFINDMHCPYFLNGDWEGEIEENEDGENMCIWYPEMTEGHRFFEFFITFKELCNATYNDGSWFIPQDKYPDIIVQFKK